MNPTILSKIELFHRALDSLHDVITMLDLKQGTSDFIYFQDSSVQRFEYTFELARKTLREIFKQDYDIITNSPKETIQQAHTQ
jgi:Nucleotidyltransferase substrate binding protein like